MLKIAIKMEMFPQLEGKGYFASALQAPLSLQQTNFLKEFSTRITPAPHSSEDQSLFDRNSSVFREKICGFLHTSLVQHAVIFYQDKQTALDSIFESFPWVEGSQYIIGLDEDMSYPLQFASVATEGSSNSVSKTHSLYCTTIDHLDEAMKYRNRVIGKHHVLIDLVDSYDIDLSHVPVDFTLLSFPQICGIGLCAAVVRLDTCCLMTPKFYGGGTIAFACARSGAHRSFKSHSARLENGTPSFLNILLAYEGFKVFLSMEDIDTCEYARRFADIVKKHSDRLSIEHIGKRVVMRPLLCSAEEFQRTLIERSVFLTVKDNLLVASFGKFNRDEDLRILDNALSE